MRRPLGRRFPGCVKVQPDEDRTLLGKSQSSDSICDPRASLSTTDRAYRKEFPGGERFFDKSATEPVARIRDRAQLDCLRRRCAPGLPVRVVPLGWLELQMSLVLLEEPLKLRTQPLAPDGRFALCDTKRTDPAPERVASSNWQSYLHPLSRPFRLPTPLAAKIDALCDPYPTCVNFSWPFADMGIPFILAVA